MKKLITFILILSTIIINAQSALDKRFIMVAEWDDNILLNDSMWRVNALFSEDQLNGGYLPTQIQVGYLALDATGRRYRVKNIVDATFSTATLDLVEEADLNMPPIGVGIVYVKNLTDIIHSVVHSNTQISPSLMSKIFIHNMVKIDEVALVSSDYTRLLQDSIVVYYANNAEIGRDTVRLNIVSDLENLADVDITGVADKNILYYDFASQKWRDTTSNVYISGSGSANRIPIYNGNTSITSNSNLTFDGTTFNANSAAVFNDAGAAVDFRVESDNDANKLFVSGSTDRVGIGINSPTNTLDIDGTLRIRTLNSVTSTGILGVDANGVAERITIGTGLNLTNDVLTATGTLSGSGTNNRVAFWSGTTSLSGNDSLFYDSANGRLGIGGITNPRVGLEVNADQIVVASNVWREIATVEDNTWTAVTFGNGLFVAVASDGTNRVMVSQDGINWNLYALPINDALASVTYGNGVFVAIGLTYSFVSVDGKSWVAYNLPSINYWLDVYYANGLFLACGYQKVARSYDGISWIQVDFSGYQGDITYGNGYYVITSPFQNLSHRSVDGVTWETYSMTRTYTDVTYGNGLFVAVTNTGTNRVATSPDGVNWTFRAIPSASWNSVTYADGLFVAVGASGVIATSIDGINWVSKNSPNTNTHRSVTYANGLFVCVSSTGVNNRIILSGKQLNNIDIMPKSPVIIDYINQNFGINVVPRTRLEVAGDIIDVTNSWVTKTLTTTSSFSGIAYGNGLFVAISTSGDKILTSQDGKNWIIRTSPDVSNPYRSITYGNGLWVIVTQNTCLYSPDGINWSYASGSFSGAYLRDVTYDNGTFVAVGLNRIFVSNDGITWVSNTYTGYFYGVTYGDGKFVTVSGGNVNAGFISYDNGISWTSFSLPNLYADITYGNGVFVAVSNAGNRIIYSYDGITWNNSIVPTGFSGSFVTYGAKLFLVPAGNSVFTSLDGINWVKKQVTTAVISYMAAAYGNGMFVLVGSNSSTAVSGRQVELLQQHNNEYNGNHRFTQNVSIGTSNQPAYSLDIPTTNAIRIPSGTTLQRPVGTTGVLRYNTSDNRLEFHNGTTWENPVSVSGTVNEFAYISGSTTLTSSPRVKFETDGGLVLKNTAEPVSSTFVASQDFTTNTNWTEGTGWIITGGLATATAATGALTYTPTVTITSGRAYLVTITQSGYSAGTVTIALGNVTSALPQFNVTSWAVLLRPTVSTGGFRFTTSTYTGSLDNVSILEITPGTVLQAFEISGSVTNNMPIVSPNPSGIAFGGGGIYTTGNNNSFIGINAGRNNTIGNNNTFIGASSGFNNSTGINNLFIGFESGFNNTIGNSNSFIGVNAGLSNTTGGSNSFIGANAGFSNTTGGNNVFIGNDAGLSNTTSGNNSYIGSAAGVNNTTGFNNSFIGASAGRNNTIGTNNSFIGVNAGFSNTTGGSNSFIGNDAGRYINSGGNLTISNTSVMIGDDTRALADNSSNEIVIGSGGRGNGNNTVTIGNSSITGHYLSGTGAVRIPTGTTAQRPTVVEGMMRLNTSTGFSEIYSASNWAQSSFPIGTANTTLRHDGTNWVVADALKTLTTGVQIATGTNLGTFIGGGSNVRYTSFVGINTSAMYLSSNSTSSDVFISYVGNSSSIYQYWRADGNIATRGQLEIGSLDATDVLNWDTGIQLNVKGTTSIKLPTGTTAQRPSGIQGMLRYNTNTMELDVHDGTNWRRVIDIADTNASTGDVVSFTGTAYAAVSQRRGLTTLTTDASGDITLSITMPDATYSAVAIPDGQTFYVITAHTKTTSSVKFRIYDSTGNIVPSGTSVSINYNITDY